jgi:hypothetical protein
MQFATLLASVSALAVGTNAAAVPRQIIYDLAQFRVFGAAGCSDLNYGFFSIDSTMVNQCNSFAPIDANTPYVSLELQFADDPTFTADGCSRKYTPSKPETIEGNGTLMPKQ